MCPDTISTVGLSLCLLLAGAAPLRGAVFAYSASPGTTVPDDDANGITLSTVVSTSSLSIEGVDVRLRLVGAGVDGRAYNGDYYVRLTHVDPDGRSEVAILMNRAGRTQGNGFGYADDGLSVTFSDAAPSGDIHAYRKMLFGDEHHAIPAPGTLTGTWGPDGRETDPAFVTEDDLRTALLSAFRGKDPNGTWTLFLADLGAGGEGRVVSWGLDITYPELTSVPEPNHATAVLAAALCIGALGCRCAKAYRTEGD